MASFIGYLNSLWSYVLIAEPITCIVAKVHIGTDTQEAFAENLFALGASVFVLIDFELEIIRIRSILVTL
jgi:hypothetical protein